MRTRRRNTQPPVPQQTKLIQQRFIGGSNWNSHIRSIAYLSILALVLLAFVFPVLSTGTLSIFSSQYFVFPWSEYKPPGCYPSSTIDPSPIYLFNPSDMLAKKLFSEWISFAWESLRWNSAHRGSERCNPRNIFPGR